MPSGAMDPAAETALAEEASEWWFKMRGPDANRARPDFEAWLAAHPNHRIMYDRIALRWGQSGLVGHTPSGQTRAGLPPAPARAPAHLWRYAIAAGIALVVGFGIVLQQRLSAPVTADTDVAIAALASDAGIRRVRLADGSIVTLDRATRLTLRFSARERRLLLSQGRARFEVAHAVERPFIVEARNREVVATGTIFDVGLAGDGVAIALLRGGVDVRTLDKARKGRLVRRLAPGEAIRLAPGSDSPVADKPGAGVRDWTSAMIEFDGTPLREVVRVANRYSARQIVLDDPALGSLQVTGGFRTGDQDSLAASMGTAFDLTVDRRGDGSVVLR